ncbi:hypothetical protein BDQ17DRAFT_1432819 [Cyathus striatus]|nr:hypothetical protein BDQ17DRAFT_1432819 [Cyathus striatus]
MELLPDYAQAYVEYLNAVSSDPCWKTLIAEWKNFEQKKPHIISFSTAKRPVEVAWWIQCHRSVSAIPDIKAAKFGSAWMAWWATIQSQWRLLDNGLLTKTVPLEGSDWESLFRGGPLGLCSVIMSLSWWVYAVQQAPDDSVEKLWNAVEDFTWVFQQVETLPVILGAK